LFFTANPYNDLASLQMKFHISSQENPGLLLLDPALRRATLAGMKRMDFNRKLAGLGCKVSFYSGEHFFTINLTGEESKLFQALRLVRSLLQNPEYPAVAIDGVKQEIKTKYKFERGMPEEMAVALFEFGVFGDKSEYITRISLAELDTLSENRLRYLGGKLLKTSCSMHFCGSIPVPILEDSIRTSFPPQGAGMPAIHMRQPQVPLKNKILLVNDKKARQSYVNFFLQGDSLQPADYAKRALLNLYLGGGFSGLVVQEIREIRSLAYEATGSITSTRKGYPVRFNGFVGCQADKTNESVETMMRLLQDMPSYPERIGDFKKFFPASIAARQSQFRYKSGQEQLLRLAGYQTDPNQTICGQLPDVKFEEMMEFYRKNIQTRPVLITIYGNKKKMDLEKLRAFGEIQEISKKDIVRY
jgi:predicted Zn-dependent peptidase